MAGKILHAVMASAVILCLVITPARHVEGDYKQPQAQPIPICAHLLTEVMVGCLTGELLVCE